MIFEGCFQPRQFYDSLIFLILLGVHVVGIKIQEVVNSEIDLIGCAFNQCEIHLHHERQILALKWTSLKSQPCSHEDTSVLGIITSNGGRAAFIVFCWSWSLTCLLKSSMCGEDVVIFRSITDHRSFNFFFFFLGSFIAFLAILLISMPKRFAYPYRILCAYYCLVLLPFFFIF